MEPLVLTVANPGDVEIYDLCKVAVRHHVRVAGLRPSPNEGATAEKALDEHLESSMARAVCFVASRRSVTVASFPSDRGTNHDFLLGDSDDDAPLALEQVSAVARSMIERGLVDDDEYAGERIYHPSPALPGPDHLTWSQLRQLSAHLECRRVEFAVVGNGDHLVFAYGVSGTYRITARWEDGDPARSRLVLESRIGIGQWQKLHAAEVNWNGWHEMVAAMTEHQPAGE